MTSFKFRVLAELSTHLVLPQRVEVSVGRRTGLAQIAGKIHGFSPFWVLASLYAPTRKNDAFYLARTPKSADRRNNQLIAADWFRHEEASEKGPMTSKLAD